MKKNLIPLFLGLLVMAASCKQGGATGDAVDSLDQDTSYAFGMLMARQFGLPGVNFDYDALMEGYKAQLQEKTKFTMEEARAKIEPVFMAALDREVQRYREIEDRFLTENKGKPGILVTPSGLQYEVLDQGTGEKPGPLSTVRVHYRGTLTDGTLFDSSYDRGEPAEFPLQGVIPGWTEGIQLMNEGASYRFFIPSSLAYGDQQVENIPPYSTLVFEVELLSIVN
jgi:FKBP-type peptidyl-prolyl cis-trans isomerase